MVRRVERVALPWERGRWQAGNVLDHLQKMAQLFFVKCILLFGCLFLPFGFSQLSIKLLLYFKKIR